MVEMLKRAVLLGIGLGRMAGKEVEEAARRLAEEATLSEGEGKRFIAELTAKNQEMKARAEERISELLKSLDLASGSDLRSVEERVTALELELVKLNQRLPEPRGGDVV